MVEVTDATFEQELVCEVPVLVKFGAEWCGPCKAIAPVLEELAAEYQGKLKIVTVDIDQTSIAQRFSIRGVPTLLFFKDGTVVNTLVGAHPKNRIQLAIDTVLA